MRDRFLAAFLLILFPLIALADPLPQPSNKDQLVRVVALFRHGIRAPLKGFMDTANDHSGRPWPTLDDWGVGKAGQVGREWGDLTNHGRDVVTTLGRYYASTYKGSLGTDAPVFLWADVDQRTEATAAALAVGLKQGGLTNVKIESLPAGTNVDVLFHPFKAKCGIPDMTELNRIRDDIKANAGSWWKARPEATSALIKALNCPERPGCNIDTLPNVVCSCASPDAKCETNKCDGPIYWKGPLSYGSGATEAFLLEYTNGMATGWGKVDVPALKTMLPLHDDYFARTDRQPYVAKIGGSNLLREIRDTLSGTPGCQHAPSGAKFVGLVGHDTNIANVAALLDIHWRFAGTSLAGIPNDDLLPAGALVFELWHAPETPPRDYVRIVYIAQNLDQMKSNTPGAVVVDTRCAGRARQPNCILKLDDFKSRATDAMDKKFLCCK
jgi:4-phytase/acid phosphatase